MVDGMKDERRGKCVRERESERERERERGKKVLGYMEEQVAAAKLRGNYAIDFRF